MGATEERKDPSSPPSRLQHLWEDKTSMKSFITVGSTDYDPDINRVLGTHGGMVLGGDRQAVRLELDLQG